MSNMQFANDVRSGLTSHPKELSSKYFYDAKGDHLFQLITQLPEYYLTRCEFEIFEYNKSRLLEIFNEGEPFNLIEFGAGDGTKTKVLLRHFLEAGVDFIYRPIDISGSVLETLSGALKEELPKLRVEPLEGEYFDSLARLSEISDARNVVLFLGSNVGNFTGSQAESFYRQLYDRLASNDVVLSGFDLKKSPDIILPAYDDVTGVTKAFNLNLLHRINRTCDADFDPMMFTHYASYDPLSGDTKSFLISQKAQTVHIGAMELEVHFDRFEPIFMERSKKFDLGEIEALAKTVGFEIVEHLFDCKHYFTDSIWVKP